MPQTRAVLLDVFNTVLSVDFAAALDGLVEASGMTRDDWTAGLSLHTEAVMTGTVTPEQGFTAVFVLAGKSPRDISTLVQRDVELLHEHATLCPDVLPFMKEMRQRGIRIALVSNCAPNTGPLLQALGLTDVADHVVLSCDVGAVKPDATIYRAALRALGVDPTEAVFVDDQADYCSGAEALGMRSIQIDRHSHRPGSVRSLEDVIPTL